MRNVGTTGLVVINAVVILTVLGVDLVEEAETGNREVLLIEVACEVGFAVAGGSGVALDVEADQNSAVVPGWRVTPSVSV